MMTIATLTKPKDRYTELQHAIIDQNNFYWEVDKLRLTRANQQSDLDSPAMIFRAALKTDKMSRWRIFFTVDPSRPHFAHGRVNLCLELLQYDGYDTGLAGVEVVLHSSPGWEWHFHKFDFSANCENKPVQGQFQRFEKASYYTETRTASMPFPIDYVVAKMSGEDIRMTVTFTVYDPTRYIHEGATTWDKKHRPKVLDMLNSGGGSDVAFQTREGLLVKAHRLILCKHSPVFDSMFASTMKEKEIDVVQVQDMGAVGLKMFFKYVYTGELDEKWWLHCDEIINAAHKYDIAPLKDMCQELLPILCKEDNCIELYQLAEMFGMFRAQKRIKRFMKRSNIAMTVDGGESRAEMSNKCLVQ